MRVPTPDYMIRHVAELDLEWLQARDLRAVVADLDNTLVGWHSEDVPAEVEQWLESLRGASIGLCIVSNTRRFKRLGRLAERLGVHHFPGNAKKPSPRGVQTALELLKANPSEAVMVGDQLFTDMVAGRRAGLTTVLVNPLTDRDFIGTKLVSRSLERLVLRGERARPK